MKVLDFPLTKITISFLIGIIVSYFAMPSVFFASLCLIASILILFFLFFLANKNKNTNILFGISTLIVSFFIGLTTLQIQTDSYQKTNYIHCKSVFNKPQLITFTLREKLKSNDYNDRFIGIINSIENKKYTGRIIVNIQKDSITNKVIIGNSIRVKTALQGHTVNKNPNQFDYAKYLTNKQIYAQVYCKKAGIFVDKKITKDIWYYSGKLHSRIIRNLQKANFNKDEMNVALALILGQQQEISPDIIQDYQYSGATHVLSVSGLHVGFIMLFINFILKPIPNNRKGSLLKLICILISLAVFAIISGLSPPVLRSVVMFSFLALGTHLRRSTNIYHTLLVSILLILLFEPYFLFDAGFQLSYLALFFILWLQPLLSMLWTPTNKILVYIWNALTVSFAAQIGTLPLCLYYFHQFPGLFFVTNIIILPLLSFIMIAGIIVMLWAIFYSPPLILVVIFEKSVHFLNLMIHGVASYESFVIKNISFHFYYLLTFYLFTIAGIIWFKKPDYPKTIALFITIILVQISFLYSKKEIESQQELIVYNIKNSTLLSDRKGKNITFITNDTLYKSNISNSYLVGNSGVLQGILKVKNTLFFNGHKILVIDSSGVYPTKMQPDILLLTQSPKINLDRMLNNLHPKIIIADGSNSYALQKRWKITCLQKNIPFHATAEKGFYKLN